MVENGFDDVRLNARVRHAGCGRRSHRQSAALSRDLFRPDRADRSRRSL